MKHDKRVHRLHRVNEGPRHHGKPGNGSPIPGQKVSGSGPRGLWLKRVLGVILAVCLYAVLASLLPDRPSGHGDDQLEKRIEAALKPSGDGMGSATENNRYRFREETADKFEEFRRLTRP